MKQTYYISLLVLIALTINSVSAQQPISLNEAISIGLENNYGIRIEENNIAIAKMQNNWQYAGAYPSLGLGMNLSNAFNERDNSINHTGLIQPSLQLNWVLFNGFAVRVRKSQFAILEELSSGNSVLVIENTIQAIVLGYYKIVLEKERLKVMEEVMNLSKDRLDYIQNRLDLGAGSTYEVLQAKNAWLTDKSTYLNQKMIYRMSMRELGYLLGQKDKNEYAPNDSLVPVTASYSLLDLKNKMEVNNRTLQNQFLNLAMLEKNIAMERSSRYPAMSFGGGANYNLYPDALNDSESLQSLNKTFSFYANFAMSFNIYNGNRVQTNIKIAEVEKEIGDIRLEDMKHQLNNRLLNVYDLYEVRKELSMVARENLVTAKLNLEISTDKYKNGVINSFNFRDIQRSYLLTALSDLAAVYELIASHVDLVRLTGGIITEYDAKQ